MVMMAYQPKRLFTAFWVLLSVGITPTHGFRCAATLSTPRPAAALPALIYGWDGQEEATDTADTTSSYLAFGSELGDACTAAGTHLAESLSLDRDRTGHLARLAVAFSPPERALTLSQIEHVDVICVYDDHIDIQAILCESAGCVSLSVPITFPKACPVDPANPDPNHNHHLEGCVIENLDQLDSQAGRVLLDEGELEAQWEEPVQDFPSWWLPPHCYPYLVSTCESIRKILNDDEFQPDLVALVQDALGAEYKVLQAKAEMVGPAGLCLKARAQNECMYGSVEILEVVHRFDQTMNYAETLRAAVLGALATADGN